MTKVTSEEINQFRTELADHSMSLAALDVLEDCEGDLEDAAIVLAIRAGQEPDVANSSWLGGLARQCRSTICQAEFKQYLAEGRLRVVVDELAASPICPVFLAPLVVLYSVKQDVNHFCDSF